MPKTNIAAELLESVRQAVLIQRGEMAPGRVYHVPVVPAADVIAIRSRLGLSQDPFARQYALPVATVRKWEQGRRKPDGAATILLHVIDRQPDAVRLALAEVAGSQQVEG